MQDTGKKVNPNQLTKKNIQGCLVIFHIDGYDRKDSWVVDTTHLIIMELASKRGTTKICFRKMRNK